MGQVLFFLLRSLWARSEGALSSFFFLGMMGRIRQGPADAEKRVNQGGGLPEILPKNHPLFFF